MSSMCSTHKTEFVGTEPFNFSSVGITARCRDMEVRQLVEWSFPKATIQKQCGL